MFGKEKNTTIKFKNIYWELYRNACVPAEPPDLNISLEKKDCHKLLLISNAWLIRWPSQWDKKEISAFWYIIKEDYKGFGEFSRNTRNKIRRGLKRNAVQKIEKKELKTQGYPVYQSAFARYDKSCKLTKNEFLQRIESLNPDQYEFWGVYQENSLVAYAEIRQMKDVINTSVLKFHPSFLTDYTSYALFYKLIEYYLGKCEKRYITNGARSISHDSNIQYFLIEKFNFRKAYCKLNVCYRPILRHFIQLIYPFKKLTGKLTIWPFESLHALLTQEYIKRHS